MDDIILRRLAELLAPYLMLYFENKANSDTSNVQIKRKEIMNELLSKNEVCKKLKVSSATLYRWDKANYLKPVKLGGKVMYRKEDLKELIKN